MSERAFRILLAITVLCVGLAVAAVLTAPSRVPAPSLETAFLPDLPQQLDRIAAIEIAQPDRTISLRREAEGWMRVTGEAGAAVYPANAEAVADLIGGLVSLRLAEPRTDRADRLHRLALDLDPPEDAIGTPTRVTLRDAAGAVLADAVLGRRNFQFDRRSGALYVRRADADQAYIARGRVELPSQTVEWYHRTIVDIPSREVAAIRYADGPAILRGNADAAEGEEPRFALADPPAGREVLSYEVTRTGRILTRQRLDAVRPRAAFGPGERLVTVETLNGMTVAIDRLAIAEEVPEDRPAAWYGFSVLAEGADAARAEALRARWQGWAYRLPSFVADQFDRDLDSFLRPPEADPAG